MLTRLISLGMFFLLTFVSWSHPMVYTQDKDYSVYKGKDILLVCILSKDQVFTGEPVTLTYKLLTKRTISEAKILTKPQLSEFTVEELSKPGATGEEKYKGEQYKSTIIKHLLLIPEDSGKITILPMKLLIDVEMPPEPSDFFITEKYSSFEITSNQIELLIKNLPLTEQPFSGALGNYTINSSISQDSVRQDETINFEIKIEGTGNSVNLLPPNVLFPTSVESYKPSIYSEKRESSTGYKSIHVYKYTLVPTEARTLELPSVSFTYFDLKKNAYITKKTSSHVIAVLPTTMIIQPTKAEGTKSGLRLLTVYSPTRSRSFILNSSEYWSLIFLILIGFFMHYALFSFLKSRNLKEGNSTKRNALKRAVHKLHSLNNIDSNSSRTVCNRISDIISTFITERFELTDRQTITAFIHTCNEHGVKEETAQELQVLVGICNEVAYSPIRGVVDPLKLGITTLKVLKRINKEAI